MDIDRGAVIRRDPADQERHQPTFASGAWYGALLVVGGALWLGDTSGTVKVAPAVFATFFALAGISFAIDFARSPRNWWAAIPAGAFLGLGSLIGLVEGTPAPGEWGASVLLAGTGLGFAAAYLRERRRWWAIIPAAALLLVALIVAYVPLADRGTGIGAWAVGIIAAALVILAVTPLNGARMVWLLIPAAILAVVAGFLAVDAAQVLEPFNWVSALVLLVLGLFIVVRTMAGRGARRGP